jgi:hypothetical protein
MRLYDWQVNDGKREDPDRLACSDGGVYEGVFYDDKE